MAAFATEIVGLIGPALKLADRWGFVFVESPGGSRLAAWQPRVPRRDHDMLHRVLDQLQFDY